MKITAVKAHVLRLPQVTDICEGTQDTCLIHIETDENVSGWGEVDSCPNVVKSVIEAPLSHQICNGLENALLGANPLAVEECMHRMDSAANYYGRVGVGAHAMAGINQALWDIAGKVYGIPVHQLFGGPFNTKFRAYCSVLFGNSPDETFEIARRHADLGFTAIKFGWGPMGQCEKNDIALIREARRGAGTEIDILVDAGQVWDWKTALRRAQAFTEYDVFWLEEPLHPQDLFGYSQLCAESPIPIAAGEAESNVEDFRRVLDEGSVDWIQPDPGRCGISKMIEVGHLAHRMHRKVVNHSFKSGITIAASLHALAAIPHGDLFEYCMSESPLRHELTNENFPIIDGFVHVPEEPGLGISIKIETLEKYLVS